MCSVFKLDLNKYSIEDVCRTCGRCDVITSASLVNIFASDSEAFLNILRQFNLWKLNISEDDSLPQKMCKQCVGKFTLVDNFRKQCENIQNAFKILLFEQRRLKSMKKIEKLPNVQPKLEQQFTADESQSFECFDEIPFEDGEFKSVQYFELEPHKPLDSNSECVKGKSSEEKQKPEMPTAAPIDGTSDLFYDDNNDDGAIEDDDWNTVSEDVVPKLERNDDDESSLDSDLLSSDDERKINRKSKVRPNQFKCEYCKNFCLENQEDLDNHVKEIHSTETPYTCSLCTKTFTNAKQRNCHFMVSHKWKSHECDVCHKMIKGGKPGLKNHKDNVHNKSDHECTICHKKFENISLSRFRYHLRWHDSSKLFSCKSCDKSFVTRYHLEEHERTHTDEKSFLCNICGLGLRCKQNLIWHMKTHTGERTYQCNQCNKAFPTPTALACHIKTHSNEKKHECEICNKLFKTKGSLKTHIGNVHKVDFNDGTPNSSPRYCCQLCPRNFIFERDLIKHLKTHEHRRHVCEVCGLSYLQSSHLKKHMDTVHLNIKPHVCSICGHAFPFEFNLKQHELTHKEKGFKCMMCDKAFTLHPSLVSHQRTHTGEKPYQCHICQKAFTNRGNLKSHVEKHLIEQKQNQTFTQIVLPVIPASAEIPQPSELNIFDINSSCDQTEQEDFSNQLINQCELESLK
ncbi:zinc finger protein 25 [Eupeodes corollae]|uniref:zinc finger protein 25 n=1 Tax=Eupeodes corollae TaxID=290404 RepID=UPI0024910E1D|nr:zinc finger protein 25 [Eupeodes corollae]